MRRPFRRKRLDRWLKKSIDSAALFGLSREDGDELLVEARRRFEAGEHEPAWQLFNLHIRAFGFSADGFLGMGACSQAMGALDKAAYQYSEALNHPPTDSRRRTDPFAWANVLECELLLGRDEAVGIALKGLAACDRPSIPPDLLARIEHLESIAKARLERPKTSANPGVEDRIDDCGGRVAPSYNLEPGLSYSEFVDLLERSTLAERRPIAEPGTIAGMLANADLIVTARIGGLLVGVSRAITDYHFCTYLSDLAVDRDFQKKGIGRVLIRRTHEAAGSKTTLILLAAPAAREYYPHIGMTAHDSCWIIPRTPV